MSTLDHVNQLAARWCELVTEQERLMRLIENPICGKPHHGFKAACRATSAKRAIDNQLAALDVPINNWISRNRKASKAERTQRQAALQVAIRACNPA